MHSRPLAILAAAATGVLGSTPAGFEPSSDTQLYVRYGNVSALNGVVIAKDASQQAPTLATAQKLNGTYAVVMVDLDIPTNTTQTNTLLHWLQTGLTSADEATAAAAFNATGSVYVLQSGEDDDNAAAAAAPYIGPNPPARNPLSHRYTEVLVDVSGLRAESLSVLAEAAETRLGFDALEVLTRAGLQGRIVAGNYFNVTNPGPAAGDGGSSNATSTGGGGSGSGRVSSGGGGGGSETSTGPASSSTVINNVAGLCGAQPAVVFGFVSAVAIYLGL